MDLGMTGSSALVSGGTRGIGWAIVQALAAEGCGIAFCGRDAARVETCRQSLSGYDVPVHGAVADVLVADELDRFVTDAAGALGGLDHVVVNAGGSFGHGSLAAADEDWLRTYDVNVLHAVRIIRRAQPYLADSPSASIVFISSISAAKVSPSAPYAVAKAAESALAANLAWELAGQRVRVNSVTPGSIDTGEGGWSRYASAHPERFAAFLRDDLPWRRLGTPDEVAAVVTFLLSRRAGWVNGAVVPVDGAQGRAHADAQRGTARGEPPPHDAKVEK